MGTQKFAPSTDDLFETFSEEVSARDGEVKKRLECGNAMFLRATFSLSSQVKRGDAINAGVAMRVVEDQISVHPYTWRKVCKNGAIDANALGGVRIARVPQESSSPFEESQILNEVVEGIGNCCQLEVFDGQVSMMRRMADTQIDLALSTATLMDGLGWAGSGMIHQIVSQFLREEPRSLYGLMNAVTAVARSVKDPTTQWRLESFGCEIGAKLLHDVGSKIVHA